MHRRVANMLIAALCAVAAPIKMGPALARQPSALLQPVFSDHMVLQRNQPVTLAGAARPDEAVTVTFAGQEQTVRSDGTGHWRAIFAPMSASGPHSIQVETRSGASQSISDILIGDVWLCSGQSNMEFPVSRALNPGTEIGNANSASIRLLSIPHDSATSARDTLPAAPSWTVLSPATIGEFSAACYFFGRELQRTHPVPFGLIDASWGGSQIEAWVSAAGLRQAGGLDVALDMLALYETDPPEAIAAYGRTWEAWWQENRPQDPAPWNHDSSDTTGWTPAQLVDWTTWPDPRMQAHLGMVWYRTGFSITAEQAAGTAILDLGGIDEVDAVWVNGKFVGAGFGWGTPRSYRLPEGVLQPGENHVLVNVLNTWGSGGMVGPDDAVRLEFPDSSSLPLGSGWMYRRVPAGSGAPASPPWESINGLTGLYNAMIAPLTSLRLRGVFWYQGESNTGRADAYQTLLQTLIADWRSAFDQELPVLIVQLANFGALQAQPVDSGWARVRDAQRRVAEADPLAGLVVAIDIGDRLDIHPPNKQELARRAARSAEAIVYGGNSSPQGAMPGAARRSTEEVLIDFRSVDTGLQAIGAIDPIGFELCLTGTGSCRYAEAAIRGGTVALVVQAGEWPTRVRYCWADAPVCNLYDGTSLPVSPFELVIP